MNDILIIKVMNATLNEVLKYSIYYTTSLPDENKFSNVQTVFIIGEVSNEEIPLIATCNVQINECKSVHSAFKKFNKDWRYEWELQNLQYVHNVKDIRKYFINESKDKITSCQVFAYISSRDISNLPQNGNVIIGSNSIINNIKPKSKIKPFVYTKKRNPLNHVYKIGDSIMLPKQTVKGTITDIYNYEEIDNGQKYIYDQKLTIQLGKVVKKYHANVLETI